MTDMNIHFKRTQKKKKGSKSFVESLIGWTYGTFIYQFTRLDNYKTHFPNLKTSEQLIYTLIVFLFSWFASFSTDFSTWSFVCPA